jgi:hypothetical protein
VSTVSSFEIGDVVKASSASHAIAVFKRAGTFPWLEFPPGSITHENPFISLGAVAALSAE